MSSAATPEEMIAAARELAKDYDDVAHVAGEPVAVRAREQLCVICGHVLYRDGGPWFGAGEVVFQIVRRADGRTTGHAAAGPGRPLGRREDFELWPGERWCDVQEAADAPAC